MTATRSDLDALLSGVEIDTERSRRWAAAVAQQRCPRCDRTRRESRGVCWPQGNMAPTRFCQFRDDPLR